MLTLSSRIRKLAEREGQEIVLCFKDGAALSAVFGTATVQVLDGLSPHEVWGTSSGALIGSAVCQGMDGLAVEHMVGSINTWELGWDLHPMRKLLGGAWFDWRIVNAWMHQWLTTYRFADFCIPMHVMTSVEDSTHKLGWSRRVYSTCHTPELQPHPALQASMAVRGVFRPVEIGGQRHIDGANATSKTWKEVATHSHGRRLLILVVNPVFAPRGRKWRGWINPTARTYQPLFALPGGHQVVVLNCVWGERHPFDFAGTLQMLPTFRRVVANEVRSACTMLEQAGDSSASG